MVKGRFRCSLLIFLAAGVTGVALAYDITKDKCVFAVGYQHLDTQWGNDRASSYNSTIPQTLHDNFALFRKYPRYIISFSGAQRYWMAEQANTRLFGNFKAGDWDTLKAYIKKGNWNPCGAMIDEIDSHIPCAEAICRCVLYGNGYFEDKFGKRSLDFVLPDCFGYAWILPTIGRHFGIRGFSGSKYDGWGGWFQLSDAQSICRWSGPDGSFLYAALRPTEYYSEGIDFDPNLGNAVQKQSGMWIVYDFYGHGDGGGSPLEADVAQVCNLPNGQYNGYYDFPASSDSLWKQIIALENAGNPDPGKLAAWDNECVMFQHGVGCYTTHGDVKIKFRTMELAGLSAEPAAVIANKLAGTAYPQAQLWRAWFKGVMHAMHDDLTGTSDSGAYWAKWDGAMWDLDSQTTSFNAVKTTSNTAVAALLNTQAAGGAIPLVVYNPLALDREDVVQTVVTLPSASSYVKVVDPGGTEVPSQVIGGGGTTSLTILFVASVPSVGYAVYGVSPSATACAIQTGLSVAADASTMSNNDYTVSIDNTGDISQIVDKRGGNRNLFQSASRWELRPDGTTNFPQWEINKEDVVRAPSAIVDGSPSKSVAEQGPVRVSVKVTRNKNGSNYTHYYRLCAGAAGRLVIVDNNLTWNTRGTLLKASFYLACSNAMGTYGLGIGAIDRPNSGTDKRYEFPAQQWGTIGNGTFGVAIMNHHKYGWSKLSNNNILLTLIHSPNPDGSRGNLGDCFAHNFSYAVYGYSGDWKAGGVEQQCQRFQLPLTALQTTAHAATAPFDKTISLVRLADPTKAMIMAVKRAEKSNEYVVRVREIAAASSTVQLLFSYNVTAAKSTNGMEDDAGATAIAPGGMPGNEVAFSIGKYQLRTIKVTLGSTYLGPSVAVRRGAVPGSIPNFDERAFQVVASAGGKQACAKFLLGGGERLRSVSIADVRGRVVRTLYNGAAPIAVSSHLTWNGADESGHAVSNGVYFVNLGTDRAQRHAALRLVR